ncbi:MAG: general secretion pathway protein GspK [Leptospiraceae bacterium]|nr:general secretion pathway protein GspK [Leptospiraceae bacterium]MCB1304817.1 general secretion pathway protein GspK [Leptospiraceae bacterium]
MIVVVLCIALGLIGTTAISVPYLQSSMQDLGAARVYADGYKARLLAQAGFQAGLAAIRNVPEEYLYSSGLILNPPDIEISKKCVGCYVSYRIQPEDGKINVNNLVLTFEDQPNETVRAMLQRMFQPPNLNIPLENVDSIVDWIDENDTVDGRGAEQSYYDSLKPPRKIKNYRLFSLSELGQVKGFSQDMLYDPRAPKGWKENKEELSFETIDEKNLITMDDWVLANNITAYLPPAGDNGRVNINAARYFTVLSLSDSMTKKAVLELFKLRRQNNGYIKDVADLRNLPSFQQETPQGVTLFDEITGGGGGESTSLIKTEGEIYRVIGIGTVDASPDKNGKNLVIRRIVALYDRKNAKLLFYRED